MRYLLFILDLCLQVHTQHCKRGCHIFILHQNIGRHLQMHIGKVPDGLDTAGNQLIAYRLCLRRRNGDDALQHLVGAATALQLIDMLNRLAIVR